MKTFLTLSFLWMLALMLVVETDQVSLAQGGCPNPLDSCATITNVVINGQNLADGATLSVEPGTVLRLNAITYELSGENFEAIRGVYGQESYVYAQGVPTINGAEREVPEYTQVTASIPDLVPGGVTLPDGGGQVNWTVDHTWTRLDFALLHESPRGSQQERVIARAHIILDVPAPNGTATLAFPSETMTGEVFLDEVPVGVLPAQSSFEVQPGGVEFVVRNIQDPAAEGFGELFVYQDVSLTVNLRSGQTREYQVRPRQEFIRGTLRHTCNPRNLNEGEQVLCQVLIDGVHRGDVTPGEAVDFILDPGERLVAVQLIGANADLWQPNFKEQTTTITVGRTRTLRTDFDKRARLIMTLNQEGVVGDFFVDEQLVAAGVPTAELWVAPNESHTIEARNLIDPAANGDYRWLDASTTARLRPGQEREVQLRLQREFLRGTLSLVCNPRGIVEGENVACGVFVDGAHRGDIVPGERSEFSVDTGEHILTLQLAGEHAYRWETLTSEETITINPGRTTNQQTSFERRDLGGRPGASASCVDFDNAVCANYPSASNCDEVVAAGIPSHDAACCFPARDRDGDGQACYGE